MSDSDDDSLPSVREIIARSKSEINLTLDDDDDSAGDKNAIEVKLVQNYSDGSVERNANSASLIDRIQPTDLLPSRPIILIAKATRTYPLIKRL
jgi:hypothetical protein